MAFQHHFTPKHVYEMKNNIMCGFTMGAWLSLLWRHRASIGWRTYWLRLSFLSFMAFINTGLWLVEEYLYGKAWRATEMNQRPIFVLGHPRTGTTHLHNLLSLDKEQFGVATTIQVGFPSSFLFTQHYAWIMEPILDKTRPMDKVRLTFQTPQEDELGVNALSVGTSPYMPIALMANEPEFRRFFTFETATKEERQRWIDSFMYFLRKLQYTRGADKRLVLKSPVHTARVKLLLELFPDAQFVYIHRDPYDVFRSAVNMADKTYWYSYLNTPTDDQIMEFILTQYETLFHEYIEGRKLIPAGNLCEVRFDDLDKDPVNEVRKIYDTLGVGNFDAVQPLLEEYLVSLGTFEKNKHSPVSDDMKHLVTSRWGQSFDEFGYDKRL